MGTKRRLQQRDMTARPSRYPQGNFNSKSCKWCFAGFEPQAPSHLYCSQVCADDAYTNRYYKRKYNIGLKEVRAMYDEQNGTCAICKTVGFKMLDSHMSGMNLDHCHDTGKVRGLLCHNCNRGLGLFQDDPTLLDSAAVYIRSHK